MLLLQRFFITILIAIVGGLLALRLRIPAGAFVGSMISVAAFNVAFGYAYFPSQTKMVMQSISGAFIALNINRNNIKEIRYIFKPAIIMTTGMLLNNIIIGFAINHFTFIDLQTALFSATPGGLVDMALICSDYGANASYVALMQLARLVCVVLIFPPLMVYLSNRFEQNNDHYIAISADYESVDTNASSQLLMNKQSNKYLGIEKESIKKLGITSFLALLGGIIRYYMGIPAGALVASMAVVSVYNVKTGKAFMPLKIRRAAQICSGAIIGMGVT